MAKFPELIAALAKVDGRSNRTVEHIARALRESGDMTTGKRGVGAPDVTLADAVNLIIALNSAEVPKDGPAAVKQFRSAGMFIRGGAEDFREFVDRINSSIDPIQRMTKHTYFGDVLGSLINDVPGLLKSLVDVGRKDLLRALTNDPLGKNLDAALSYSKAGDRQVLFEALRLQIVGPKITFDFGPRARAKIEFYTLENGERVQTFEADYVQEFDNNAELMRFGAFPTMDRQSKSSIGFATLFEVWQLFQLDSNK